MYNDGIDNIFYAYLINYAFYSIFNGVNKSFIDSLNASIFKNNKENNSKPLNSLNELLEILSVPFSIKEELIIEQKNNEGHLDVIKEFDFEGNKYPFNSLTLYNINKELFYTLSEEARKEMLEKGKIEYEKERKLNKYKIMVIRENASLNTFAIQNSFNIKEKINEKDWENLLKYITNLDEREKKYIFKTMPYELVQKLPNDLKNEAKHMRKNIIEFYKPRKEVKENANSCSSSLLTIT